MRSSNRYLAGIAALAAGALLAGCGSGAGTASSVKQQDALSVVAAAQSASQKAGSAKMSLTMQMSVGGQDISMTGDGAMDFAKSLGKMSMSMPNPAGSGTLTFDEVITDTTIYLKSPLLAHGAKPWVAIDLKEAVGGSLSQLAGGGSDPTSGLEMLAGAKSVTTVGAERLRGIDTTHYKAVIDLNKALKGKPASVRAKLESYQKLLGAKMTDYPVDVWIDGKGRPAKFAMTMDMPASAATDNQPLTMTMTIEIYDYGTPVTVTIPPASQVSKQAVGGSGG